MDEDEVIVAMLVGMGMPERVAEWTCEFLRERGSGASMGKSRSLSWRATPTAGCNTSAPKRWS